MSQSLLARQLWFTGHREVVCREDELAPPAAGEALVRTCCSAISAGTELLVYRGKIPREMPLDSTLGHFQELPDYPLQYGYACVGIVEALGPDTHPALLGKRVFSFQPHASRFVARADALMPIPDDVPDEAAIFLPNMETAVNLVQDGAPMIGENVVVLGQGVVGLLLTALLAQHPLGNLLTLDALPQRRAQSLKFGATASEDPGVGVNALQTTYFLSEGPAEGADLIYEVSGAAAALNTAIALSGFDSRIVVGSWYGTSEPTVALGGKAHRNRLRISTSQVSTLASSLGGRWDKRRRYETVWRMIRRAQPQQLISHRVSLDEAADIYRQLDNKKDSSAHILQAVFYYNEDN